MKRILICAVLCAVVNLGFAQRQDHKMMIRDHQVENKMVKCDINAKKHSMAREGKSFAQVRADRMKTDLTLSDEQYKAILNLFEQEELKKQQHQANAEKPTEAQIKKHRADIDNQLKTILTDEQFDLMIQLREKRRAEKEQFDKKHKNNL